MEIRELTENDLPSLLELYVQLAENNKDTNFEEAKRVWAKK